MSASKVAVQVKNGWAVFDGTEHRTRGAVLSVSPDVAARWIAAGWVHAVVAPPRARKRANL